MALLLASWQLNAQNVQNLEQKKNKLKTEISYNKQLLSEIKEQKQESLSELKVLQKQLSKRQGLINTLSQQLDILSVKIDSAKTEITNLTAKRDTLRNQYARMVRHAYKNKSNYSFLTFLLSAQSFNDAFKRLKYIKYYNDDKRNQVEQINATTDTLNVKIEALQVDIQKQSELLTQESEQKKVLDKEKQKVDGVINKLKAKEKELKRANQKKQTTIRQLNNEIQSIIKGENQETPNAEIAKLSSDFKKNKNKLPWPVKKGLVTGKFGKQAHPILKGIYVNNNGIYLTCKINTSVQAVFSGKVSQVIYSPSFQSAVIIKHGGYFTVYSNLTNVSIKKGDQVSVGQTIGTIHTDAKTNKTELDFQVWKGTKKLNPLHWLKKR